MFCIVLRFILLFWYTILVLLLSVALKLGGLLALPKALLDPRRPLVPTQETM